MNTAIALLISVTQLLTLAQNNPRLPQSFRDNANLVANQAISFAKEEIAKLSALPKQTVSSSSVPALFTTPNGVIIDAHGSIVIGPERPSQTIVYPPTVSVSTTTSATSTQEAQKPTIPEIVPVVQKDVYGPVVSNSGQVPAFGVSFANKNEADPFVWLHLECSITSDLLRSQEIAITIWNDDSLVGWNCDTLFQSIHNLKPLVFKVDAKRSGSIRFQIKRVVVGVVRGNKSYEALGVPIDSGEIIIQ